MHSIIMREHAQRLFYYDRWANDQVFTALAAMDKPPDHAVQRMNHVVAALDLWQCRLSGKPNPKIDLLSPGWSLEEGKRRLGEVHDGWASILAPLTDDDLFQTITWTRYEGGQYRAMLRDIVTQLPMHGSYHRGQLSILLKDLLPGPFEIDYIFTTWEPAPEPAASGS